MLETTIHKPPMRGVHRPGYQKTICRECGVEFQCANEYQLCDLCLVEHINGAGILEVDESDIFARPPRALARQQAQAKPTINRCVVEGFPADVLLCRECLDDIPAARSRVRTWLDANLDTGQRIIATFDAIREPQQAAWDRIQASREQPDYAAKCAKHRASGNIYGQLLDAHAAMEQSLAPLGIERARLEKALEVLDSL